MKVAAVVARRLAMRRKATPMAKTSRAKRTVPNLSAEEESFLSAISSSGNFTVEKTLERYSGTPLLMKATR
jgi:hypothetical protein